MSNNDESLCHSVKVAMDKIAQQHALGHNVVQGRLDDINQLSQQLLQDLESGVYGTKPKTYKVCKHCGKPL